MTTAGQGSAYPAKMACDISQCACPHPAHAAVLRTVQLGAATASVSDQDFPPANEAPWQEPLGLSAEHVVGAHVSGCAPTMPLGSGLCGLLWEPAPARRLHSRWRGCPSSSLTALQAFRAAEGQPSGTSRCSSGFPLALPAILHHVPASRCYLGAGQPQNYSWPGGGGLSGSRQLWDRRDI